MHFSKYTVEDLIVNPAFIKWVKNPVEEEGVEWVSLIAENQNIVDEARAIILELAQDGDTPVQQELNELWHRISASNEAFDRKEGKGRSRPKIFNLIRSWQQVAAAVVAILAITAFAVLYLGRNEEHQTTFAENKRIDLPDGSTVVLNANSSISYSRNWDKDKPREIWLRGEGFFSVTHKSNSQKFIVHTNDLDVQVLGTKFDVNTRREKTRVILNTGKVKLYLAKEEKRVVEMVPGELVDFSVKEEHLVKKTVKSSKYSSWVDKKLVFEDTSLKEIAQVLEDSYGYKVKFTAPELSKLTFTGTVDSENIDLLFTILQKTFNISVIKKEGTITFTKK